MSRHPEHEAIGTTIHGWYYDPYSGMGYSNKVYPWGVVWNIGHVHLTPFNLDYLGDILKTLDDCYGDSAYNLNIEDPQFAERLRPKLLESGFRLLPDELFLANVDPGKLEPVDAAIELETVTTSNVREFARARLEAFASPGHRPNDGEIEIEARKRSAEMEENGRGIIARIADERCGGIWWYEEDRDAWILYLGTHARYRRRGVATRLITECHRVKDRRSLLINVVEDNVPARTLYEKVGFRDEVYRKRRFRLVPEIAV